MDLDRRMPMPRSHGSHRHHEKRNSQRYRYDPESESQTMIAHQGIDPKMYTYDPSSRSRRQEDGPASNTASNDRLTAVTAAKSYITPDNSLDRQVPRLYSYQSESENESVTANTPIHSSRHVRRRSRSQSSSISSVGNSQGQENSMISDIVPDRDRGRNRIPGTLGSSRFGENVYSRISDDATLPRPNIFIPPPPSDEGPPMPPRIPPNFRKTSNFATQTLEKESRTSDSGFESREVDFQPQFLAQTPSGCIFIPAGNTSPPASPVLTSYRGVGTSRPNAAANLPQPNRASFVNPAMEVQQEWVPPGFPSTASSRNDSGCPPNAIHPARPNAPYNQSATTTLPNYQQSVSNDTKSNRPQFASTGNTRYMLKKQLQRRCSWKCIAVAMVLVCAILATIVAYFIAMKVYNLPWSLETAVAVPDGDSSSTNSKIGDSSLAKGGSTPSSVIAQYSFGRTLHQSIPPLGNWQMRFYLPNGEHVRFNLTVPSSAVIGIYGRQGMRPSHAQFDFFHVVDGRKGAHTENARHSRSLSDPSASSDLVHVAFLQNMEAGIWYVFTYNDCNEPVNVAFMASIQEETSSSSCSKNCHGHGECLNGVCNCYPGYTGPDCGHRSCPVVCHGHGQYIKGRCECLHGWSGAECELPSKECQDPKCSGNGICIEGVCICSPGYTGYACREEICKIDCGVHGRCENRVCVCHEGWTGDACDSVMCDPRCSGIRGTCTNGTCACNVGWNGKHCSIEGCPGQCGSHGQCQQLSKDWKCHCDEGWRGSGCRIAEEITCDDNLDDDEDGLVDCQDPDCCLNVACRDSIPCRSAPDPMEILLRKQPPSSTASFYERMRFLIEDDSVQSYATLTSFNHSQVSVIRGQVVGTDGNPLVGVRVSIVTQPLYGFTLTREYGLFDILVNGGGSVTLNFMRQPFKTKQKTVMVPWNRMVTMDVVTLVLDGQNDTTEVACPPDVVHDHYFTKPVVLSTWQHTQHGACPTVSTIIPESQVLQESLRIPGTDVYLVYRSSESSGYMSTIMIQLTGDKIPSNLAFVYLRLVIEGLVYEKLFEADANLKYKFPWDRRNAYNQKVFGIVSANVAVGYQYTGCSRVFWEMQSATVSGYDITSSEIGGWNLHIHHTYNFQEGILHKGDGTSIYLKERPRKVMSILGNGRQRRPDCKGCEGKAEDSRLLAPVALASGRDGSLYIGDYNNIRKLGANREDVTSVLQMSMPEVPYKYYMTVSPLDGKLYVSDYQSLRIIRIKTMGTVRDLTQNYEVIAGTGEQCIPGDQDGCGDGGSGANAKLFYPKGIAINKDGMVFFADGANIRSVDTLGKVRTLIGSQDMPKYWEPLPCTRVLSVDEVTLHWPTALAVNPLDNTVHILDNNMVLKITTDNKVVIVAGRPLHCPPKNSNVSSLLSEEHASSRLATDVLLHHPQHIAFAPNGDLYIVESDGKTVNQIRMVNTDGEIVHFAGAKSKCDCRLEDCRCFNGKEELAMNMLLNNPTSVAITPDGVLHIADMGNLRIHSVLSAIPNHDRFGQYNVLYPQSQELYIFNRYGQHVATKNFVTDQFVYNFTYNVNSYYSKLMKVTDGSGNNLLIKRDYRLQAKELVPPNGQRCQFIMDNMGQLQAFITADNFTTKFTYNGNSGLITSKETSQGLGYLYEHDDRGRLQSVILPTGQITDFDTDVDPLGAIVRLGTIGRHAVTMATNRNSFMLVHGDYNMKVSHLQDGSLTLEYPFNMAVTLETSPHPLLSTDHQLFVKRKIILPDGLVHRLEWRYYHRHEGQTRRSKITADRLGRRMRVGKPIAARLRHGEVAPHATNSETSYWGYEGKILTVNGENLLTFEYDRDDNMETVLNRHHEDILVIQYDSSGRPVQMLPKVPIEGVNITYDQNGHMTKWVRGDMSITNIYDERNLLSERRSGSRSILKYLFKKGNKPTDVILASGIQYQIQYDSHSNVKAIITPNLARHQFYYVSLPNTHRISYLPPQSIGQFIMDYNTQGHLTQIRYPSGRRRVAYYYTADDQPSSVAFDQMDVRYDYYKKTLKLRSAIIQSLNSVNYSCELVYKEGQALVSSHVVRIRSSDADLLGAEFSYTYDNHFRVTALTSDFRDGSFVSTVRYNYSSDTGHMEAAGSFRFESPQIHREVVHDENVVIVNEFDKYGRHTDTWYTFNDYVVFNTEVKYDSHGRIYQWRRKIGSSDLRAYEYVYDVDGKIADVLVSGRSTWKFDFDENGNVIRVSNYDKVRNMATNGLNQVENSGHDVYTFDSDGFVVKRGSEVFDFNSLGLLSRVIHQGKYDVRYFYDAYQRLVALADASKESSAIQFFYANLRHKNRVTHVYDHNSRKLSELFYNGRDRLFAVKQDNEFYYIGLDPHGSPILILNSVGGVVRQMSYDPFGRPIGESVTDYPFMFGYRGGIADPSTKLVFFDSRVYDPMVGRWMSPDYRKFVENIDNFASFPEMSNFYQYSSGIDRIWSAGEEMITDMTDWLPRLGYDYKSLVPIVSFRGEIQPRSQNSNPCLISTMSVYHCAFEQDVQRILELSSVPRSRITTANKIDMDIGKAFASLENSFLTGIVVSINDGKVNVTALESANATLSIIMTSLFNNSLAVDLHYTVDNRHVSWFVKENQSEAVADLKNLPLAVDETTIINHVNITVKRHYKLNNLSSHVDVQLVSSGVVFNLRYGTTVELERRRILSLAQSRAVESAWHMEQERVINEQPTNHFWTIQQRDELLRKGQVANVSVEYLRGVDSYPELSDDPHNIKFVNKR